MALIVEDGTGKVDSNTYIDAADFRAWADSIGEGDDLPILDDDLEPLLLQAMYPLEAECWLGYRTFPETPQALSFPRTGLAYDGVSVPPDSVPQQVIDAQSSYALTVNKEALYTAIPAGTAGAVIHEEVVGAVVVKYSDNGSDVTAQTEDTRAQQLISPFTCSSTALFGIRA
jgi:hypothetical protein